MEPFRIKSVEPIHFTTREERAEHLEAAGYNLFKLASRHVIIDLLTDSGTGAMSAQQWAGMLQGDESYAGADSWYRFESTLKGITGYQYIIPVHQGRAGERIVYGFRDRTGKTIPNNTHFDTTRANIEAAGGRALDLPCVESMDTGSDSPFKGNMDLVRLEEVIVQEGPDNVPMVVMTVTNNSGGGQPVSLANLRAVREITARYGITFLLDACRFAENAYFIKLREPGQEDRSVREIAKEIFDLTDGAVMSAKKDGLVNIGGWVGLREADIASMLTENLILTEGFVTYGGLAGRDLEAMAIGHEEVLQEEYLAYRIESTAYLAALLRERGVPLIEPPGGHAVYIDAGKLVPHIPPEQLPGFSLATELYLEGGIRSCEIGSVMFGTRDAQGLWQGPQHELVRLAIPRRVYTKSHLHYVAEVAGRVVERVGTLKGYRIVEEPERLRHFSGRFAPIG